MTVTGHRGSAIVVASTAMLLVAIGPLAHAAGPSCDAGSGSSCDATTGASAGPSGSGQTCDAPPGGSCDLPLSATGYGGSGSGRRSPGSGAGGVAPAATPVSGTLPFTG